MTDENLSAVLYGVKDLRLENRPIRKPNRDEVLLRMDQVGICGSDVHYWVDGKIGRFVVKAPMVMGHEAAGIVHEVGEGVTHLKPGDRVAIEPGVSCRKCENCKIGRYNLCVNMVFCATPPVDGNLSRYYTHAADFCFKLPDHVTMEEGALLEPLAVAVHSCERARIGIGARVLITGAGPIGLVTLLMARCRGASSIIMTDISQSRLDVAQRMGADQIMLVGQGGDSDEALAAKIVSLNGGHQFDASIECSGASASIRLGIFSTRPGGTLILVGRGSYDVTLPIVNAASREIDIRGVFRYANCYPTALDLIARGIINVKPLVTHRFKLEESNEAFETARTFAGGAIKVMISC